MTVSYQPGRFSRLLDVELGGHLLKANVYGKETAASEVGVIELPASEDVLLSVSPAAPRERGAQLDVEIRQVSLTLQ